MNNPKKLHEEFVRLGGLRHKLKNKMLAILPEIYKSGIWKKYTGSIVEYAGKYGDIAKTTVIKRLRLEENLIALPCLKAAIEKAGVHKVAMIAKIATPESDQKLAESVLNMSKMAVQSLSKELREKGNNKTLFDNFADNSNPMACKAVVSCKKIELDEESTFLFIKLKAKIGKNLSDRDFLRHVLEIAAKFSDKKPETMPKNLDQDSELAAKQKSVTGETLQEPRWIRVDKKRRAIAKTNEKCAYPHCNLPYAVLHHTKRYSESKNHDSIVPLCKIHHEFAHNGLIKNETLETNQWQMSVTKSPNTKIPHADILYRKYRQGVAI